MTTNENVHWDGHILVVFSVLAGLAFQKVFDFLQNSGFLLVETILSIAVFYVILDNWYYLHKDLALFNVEKPIEVVFYVLSTVVYSCLPFLYGANSSKANLGLNPPEWFLLNLVMICLFDAFRKAATIYKFHNNQINLEIHTRRLVGSYTFCMMTGFFYAVILLFLLIAFKSSNWDLLTKTFFVVGIWGLIRATDNIIIPRVSDVSARIFLENGTNNDK